MVTALLVNSNPAGRAARRHVLLEMGLSVEACGTAAAAIAGLRAAPPAILIAEHRLPDGDGIELIRLARELAPAANAILLCEYACAGWVSEKSTGADAVIAKSANEVDQLVRAVRRLLRPSSAPPKAVVAVTEPGRAVA